jgi:hypothetical protein
MGASHKAPFFILYNISFIKKTRGDSWAGVMVLKTRGSWRTKRPLAYRYLNAPAGVSAKRRRIQKFFVSAAVSAFTCELLVKLRVMCGNIIRHTSRGYTRDTSWYKTQTLFRECYYVSYERYNSS